MFFSPIRLCLFLIGFFLGGGFPTLATGANSFVRFFVVSFMLWLGESYIPRPFSIVRAGFIFGLFVDAFKVGS